MRLINQSYEICNQTDFSISGIYKHIEKCTRVAYKSEDKITEDSAISFVNKLLNMKHFAPMEFGTVHFRIPTTLLKTVCIDLDAESLWNREWLKYNVIDPFVYFTTNYRHWLVMIDKIDYLKDYFTEEDNEYYPKRYTVKLITNRAVSHEVVRHRTMSFIQESQRFVNYSKAKFNNEVTFIKPCWMDDTLIEKALKTHPLIVDLKPEILFVENSLNSEQDYLDLLKLGYKPQQARVVLPNSTKTELYMCGFKEAWENFFELRDNKIVDPQMYDLAHPMHQEFINNKYL